jgi:hypothetical protein
MELMEIPKIPKNPLFFCCENCDYITSNKKDFTKHKNTLKHKNNANGNEMELLEIPKSPNIKSYICNCHKVFKTTSGLWKHNQKCKNIIQQNNTDTASLTSLVFEVVKSNNEIQKQNQEIQKQMIEAMKHNSITNNTINANNSHNKTFNLQVFLNEECKDAMNISDFMSSIQLQLEELESVGRLGFVEGISNIIIKNLKALDIRKRPVHCTDLKRETVYIKENGVWVKDDEPNTKLRKVIKNVSFRNSKNTRLYKDKYPDCVRSESRRSDIYSIIIIEAMGGGSKTDPKEEEDKIVRRILKELVFDKSRFLS